jgi:GT2 family glycosyltransferase
VITDPRDDGAERRLGIVVVAFRSQSTLGRLLGSAPAGARVVVVDNAGDPETARICAAPGVVYVDPGANLGYAAAVNLGVAALEGDGDEDLLLVLNPDVELQGDPRRVAPLLDDPSVLVATGALADGGGTSSFGNLHPLATTGRELLRGLVGWRAYRWDTAAAPDGPLQADGAWLLFSRHTWRRVGGLDERYELYFEDVALAHRIRELGGRTAVADDVVGHHAGGVSAARSEGLSHLLLGVSRVRFYHLSGITRFPRALGITTSVLEYVSRSATLRPEGFRLRGRALRLQLREALRPGSVWLLGEPRPLVRS